MTSMAMPRTKTSDESTTRTPKLPRWAEPAAWATALAGLTVALAVWVPRLADRAADAPLPAPIRVVLADAPAWLPRDERIAIERTVLRSLGSSPFDQDGLREAMDAVRQCGWHADVRQVHRTDVDEVVVEGAWAVPFALVCDGAVIGDGATVRKSIIGIRTVIGPGCNLDRVVHNGSGSYDFGSPSRKEAIPFGVGEYSVIRNAIIDRDSRIGRGVRLVNERNVQEYQDNHITVRDGIIVVPRHGVVPDGYTF